MQGSITGKDVLCQSLCLELKKKVIFKNSKRSHKEVTLQRFSQSFFLQVSVTGNNHFELKPELIIAVQYSHDIERSYVF